MWSHLLEKNTFGWESQCLGLQKFAKYIYKSILILKVVVRHLLGFTKALKLGNKTPVIFQTCARLFLFSVVFQICLCFPFLSPLTSFLNGYFTL